MYCHFPALFMESESSKLNMVLDLGIFFIGIIRNFPRLSSITQISALCHGLLIAVYQPFSPTFSSALLNKQSFPLT